MTKRRDLSTHRRNLRHLRCWSLAGPKAWVGLYNSALATCDGEPHMALTGTLSDVTCPRCIALATPAPWIGVEADRVAEAQEIAELDLGARGVSRRW